ncbi:methyltransferase-like protein [Leptotrombidium deliense]|uniref:Acetylserotonin O-methyltransferase n=1 Tax=Leptotrombidium deliense TaxID=299467 RepID=A0A443SHG1_9ACAR|nr:methyltransferase-like protein [Leptotrombidium deliense]
MSGTQRMKQAMDLIYGASRSFMVYTAVKLEIVDHLFQRPMNAEQLAVLTNTKPELLYRFLRALVSIRILDENENKMFSVTELGLMFKSGHENSVKNFMLMVNELIPQTLATLDNTLQKGEHPFEHVYGMSYFDYISKNAYHRNVFDDAMQEYAKVCRYDLLPEKYNYGNFKHIVDVGGGLGDFLISILQKYENVTGTVFDVKDCIEKANIEIAKNNLQNRCSTKVGDFFDCVPGDADCYTLRGVLHNWDEKNAFKILCNIRKVMKTNSKLLIIEETVPETNEPHVSNEFNVVILAFSGGEARTKSKLKELGAKAMLRLDNFVEIEECCMSMIEFSPV